jgi:hypothetical protein
LQEPSVTDQFAVEIVVEDAPDEGNLVLQQILEASRSLSAAKSPSLIKEAVQPHRKAGELVSMLEYSHLLLEGVTAVAAVLAVYLQTRPKYKLTVRSGDSEFEVETSDPNQAQIAIAKEVTSSGTNRIRYIVRKR